MLQRETAASPARRAAALAGLRAYQDAPRSERSVCGRTVARAGRARLIDYSDRDNGKGGRPVVLVPSLINPPIVLDLTERTSLTGWLATQGLRPLLVEWGTPGDDDQGLTIAGHVETLLLPLLRSMEPEPLLVGYCLGGTMALAAAQHHAVAGVALLAAPWHFAGFGDGARRTIADLWASAFPSCAAIGRVPMEVLQAGFWQLDPARTIGKFERFAAFDPASDAARAFVALEDWANGGAPLTLAAGRDLFDCFIGNDDPGNGRWQVAGAVVDPARLAVPVRQFISATDRIVPAATAASLGDVTVVPSGHVGMIVGSGARAQIWEPLARWCTGIGNPR